MTLPQDEQLEVADDSANRRSQLMSFITRTIV